MQFHDTQDQPILSQDPITVHDMDNMINSMIEGHFQGVEAHNNPESDPLQSPMDGGILRIGTFNMSSPCVDSFQFVAEALPLFSPPITPDGDPCDNADVQSDCDSCIKCLQKATTKADKRRQQNRVAQRTYRARKEAELSKAKSRILYLEQLLKAQQNAYIQLKYIVDQLNTEQMISPDASGMMDEHTHNPTLGGDSDMNSYFAMSPHDQPSSGDWLSSDGPSS